MDAKQIAEGEVVLVDACIVPEPYRTRWLAWLTDHCPACGGLINAVKLDGRSCPCEHCIETVRAPNTENLLERLGIAWRNAKGPARRLNGVAWAHIRNFFGEVMHWYEEECDLTGLPELDLAFEKLLKTLIEAGG